MDPDAAFDRVDGLCRRVAWEAPTGEALRELGREPDVEATRHDIDGLVDALVADAGDRQG